MIPEEVMNILLEWKEIAPKISKTKLGERDCVFGNRKSPNWTYAGFRSSVNRTLTPKSKKGVNMPEEETKMKSLRLHRLRHTVATMLSNEADANTYDIMQLLGHSQLKTAQRYIDRATEERIKKNKELMKRLSAKSGLLGEKKDLAPDLAPKEGNEGLEE